MFAALSALIILAAAPAAPAGVRMQACTYTPATGLVREELVMLIETRSVMRVVDGVRVPFVEDEVLKARRAEILAGPATISLGEISFAQFGPPRVIRAADFEPEPVATYRGVPMFVAKGEDFNAGVFYMQKSLIACQWQPFKRQ